ncbi:Predicted nucleotidyltransferase [Evansella caseinilytica]|uniref:tRNA(Met) cytidine acetate ligase n=1 Tax=Evansella caseinilytica TaxID=1503961 RepID=A0A1H3MIZ6_9BACI|nr:nucleotidyltransferase [Evansella caseinilytica]SDY76610.1 Predicted nucleotidyltransferase [Evansella caseinilytica]
MNILGIVVEYNPFHYGHLYHLQASVKKTNADLTIAVMSGSFLQRGEPALTDKWSRTKMALLAGVDLVIELPYIYAVQKAEIFSDGAISLLDHLGVTHLCFGSEAGNIDAFITTVEEVATREAELDEQIQAELKRGCSYPKAFSTAYRTIFQQKNVLDLGKPNNILGYHYVKALRKRRSSIKPFTVTREQAGYHETALKNEKIASATAIRRQLIENGKPLTAMINYLPPSTFQQLANHRQRTGSFLHWELYFPYIQYRFLTSDIEHIQRIYECEEGLEYRLKKLITDAASFQELMKKVKSKRYTWTRIQRLFVHLLLNTTETFMKEHCRPLHPPYIRLLGMSPAGRAYLSVKKKELIIPLVTRVSEYDHPALQKDTAAAQIHGLPLQPAALPSEEYKAFPVQLETAD